MNRRVFLSFCLVAIFLSPCIAQEKLPDRVNESRNEDVIVSGAVAALVSPILNEAGSQGDESRLNNLLQDLIRKRGHAADEALVVLMCFDLGESQEETDEVIARGKRMLPLLNQYQYKTPKVLGSNYPTSILRGKSNKADVFAGAVKAIRHGWRSTADNPEG